MLKSAAKLGVFGAIAVLIGKATMAIAGFLLAWTVGIIVLAAFLIAFFFAAVPLGL